MATSLKVTVLCIDENTEAEGEWIAENQRWDGYSQAMAPCLSFATSITSTSSQYPFSSTSSCLLKAHHTQPATQKTLVLTSLGPRLQSPTSLQYPDQPVQEE